MNVSKQLTSDIYVLTPEGWKPARPIEYEPPNPPLWAKPLIWLFNRLYDADKKGEKQE